MQAAAGDRPDGDGRRAAGSGRPVARLRALATPANLWSLAFFVVLLLVRFTPPRAEISTELDESWQQAYPYFHSRGLQAGVDYVFTYGPLAHLEIGHFFAEQFWTRVLVWQLGLGSLLALLHVLVARRIAGFSGRAAYTLLLLLAAQVSESYCFATISAACAWLLDDERRSRARLALGLLVLAVLALVKFPYLLLAVLGAVAIAAAWSLPRAWLAGAGVLAGFAGLMAALWIAAGQRMSSFPPYLETSRELARGYAQAMQLPAPGAAIVLAVIALASSLAWFAWWSLARPRSPARALTGAVLAAATLLAYKSSFVLFDRDGAFFLFAGVAVLLPLAVRAHAPRWSGALSVRAGIALRGVASACALLGAPSVLDGIDRWPKRELAAIPGRCADSLACLRNLRAFQEAQRKSAWEHATLHALPRMRALVGNQPVDYFGVSQARLLHGAFPYRPRPVFQAYAAFTPALMELNRRFYASEQAPPFVVVDLQPFPYHMGTMEDGLALQTIVRDYVPVLCEQGLLLWQRRPPAERAAEATREVVLDRGVALGEWLELGELEPLCHVARIELEPTLLGRLRELAYQPALLFLELKTAPRTYRFRFGPEMARAGLILDPLIGNQRDFPRWAAGLPVQRPRAIRIVTEGPLCYEREARVVIERAPDLRPEPPPGAVMEFVYPMFHAQPASEALGVYARTRWVGGREVLVVGVPAELAFEVEPGEWRLRGVYGCELPPAGVATTGVDFRVTLAGSERPLFQRALDPLHVPADRMTQELDVPFQCASRTRLLLLTSPRTRSKTAVDAAYWSELRIEPASAPGKTSGDG